MENQLPVNVEVKADITDTVNNAYNDLVAPTAKETGKGLAFTVKFLGSLVRPYMYQKIAEAEYKIKEIDRKLELKYSLIPDDNKTQPRTCILGPALDVLKYNLDEEQIKEMFISILSNELDNRTQKNVLPSYISVVSQLSKRDALFLKMFKDRNNRNIKCINVKIQKVGDEGSVPFSKFICTNECVNTSDGSNCGILFSELDDLIIDNLIRLNLINLTFDKYYTGNEIIYERLFNIVSQQYDIGSPSHHFIYDKGCLELTRYGQNFIDICLS